MIRRHSSQRTTSSGGGRPDPGQVGAGQLEPAAAAAAAGAAAPRRARRALADLVVQGDQVGRAGRRRAARGRTVLNSSSLAISASASSRRRSAGVALARAPRPAGPATPSSAACGGLALLHQLQLGVLQLALPAVERGQLVLQRLQLAGRAGAGVEPVLVLAPCGPGPARCPSPAGRCPGRGRRRRPGRGPARPPARTSSRASALELGELGQRRAPVRELGQRGVDGLQVEQAALGLRVGLHGQGSLSSRCGCGGVHGPRVGVQVGHDRRRRRAVSRSQAASVVEPGSLGRPVGGVEQRRAAGGEVLARRMVAQVGGEVRVDAGARSRRPGSCRPRRRRPPPWYDDRAPGRRRRGRPRRWRAARAAACRVSSARVIGRGSSPIRPRPRPSPAAAVPAGAGRSGRRSSRPSRAARASETPGLATSALVCAT